MPRSGASLINRTHDELRHAQILAERIIELGGVPALTPGEWLQRARCVYDAPTSYDSPQLLRSLVIGASCLAQRYEELSEITRGSDLSHRALLMPCLPTTPTTSVACSPCSTASSPPPDNRHHLLSATIYGSGDIRRHGYHRFCSLFCMFSSGNQILVRRRR